MDYVTQQYKLFPCIATCFAMRFSAGWLWEMYNNVTSELEAGDLERLPEVCSIALNSAFHKSLNAAVVSCDEKIDINRI